METQSALSHQKIIQLSLGFLFILLIAACQNILFNRASVQLSPSSASECRVVKHDLGEACVPLNPKRVVVLSGGLDGLIALGVKPFGTTEKIERFKPYLTQAEAKAINYVGIKETGPSLEAVLKLKPDLILEVAWGKTSLTYQHLSPIVPMVVVIQEADGQWKPTLLKFAEALGKTKEAEHILAAYNARLAEFKKRMGDRLNHIRVSLVRIYANGISFYYKTSFSGSILADAGLQRPSAQAKTRKGQNQEQVNKELIHVLDSDIMFVWTYGHTSDIDRNAQSALKRLQTDPIWSTLEVVQHNQVYEVPSLYWFADGPIAANLVVDDLFKYLVKGQ